MQAEAPGPRPSRLASLAPQGEGPMGEYAMSLKRRAFLQLASAAGVMAPFVRGAAAAGDAATIGWPNDVPSWDPNQRFTPDAQPIFKAVYDQPLDQDAQLKLIPHLIKKWELAPDATSMAVE